MDKEKQGTGTDMSWDFFPSAFRSSSSGGDLDAADDLPWAEIELAERYMVSAMYEDAASTASTTLRTLSSQMHTSDSREFCSINDREDQEEETVEGGEMGKSEHEAMLESAGMVVLQTYYALGRVSEFFDTLKSLNVGVAELPPTLLFSGACLQISAGAFPAARAALEEFLAVRSIANSEDFLNPMTKPAEKDNSVAHASIGNGKVSSKMYLMGEMYADIVELYVVQVLVKGLQKTESALDWVERANLTEERRTVILKKIQLQTERAKTTEQELNPLASVTTMETTPTARTSSHREGLEKTHETTERNDQFLEARDEPGANGSSLRLKSLAMLKTFRNSDRFFSLKALLELALTRLNGAASTWQPVSMARLRALSTGALISLFLYFLLGQRHTLTRLASKSCGALKIGLRDFWQLAFSVQINPLAAVSPIARSTY